MIPEPSTIALFGVASFVIGGVRRFINNRFLG
ncbi:MAG: PEP-CTERM sorting domain-containing protein [Kiritimatiellales bacterium]|nr:PEP-CTERM sorting domain-containing protein [Kiritimatiellota bacterium]MBL7011924.1 PEP-CTERM sorting domain-containing protein [Kiritimatiellales bacterium]